MACSTKFAGYTDKSCITKRNVYCTPPAGSDNIEPGGHLDSPHHVVDEVQPRTIQPIGCQPGRSQFDKSTHQSRQTGSSQIPILAIPSTNIKGRRTLGILLNSQFSRASPFSPEREREQEQHHQGLRDTVPPHHPPNIQHILAACLESVQRDLKIVKNPLGLTTNTDTNKARDDHACIVLLTANGDEFIQSVRSTIKQDLPISAPGVCQDVSLGRKSHQREAEGYPTRWRQSYYRVQRCRGSSLPSIRAEAFQLMSLSKQTINETWQRESKTLPLLYYTSVWSIPCDGDSLGIDLNQDHILSLKPCPLPGLNRYSVSLCISLCLGILSPVNIFAYYTDRVGLPPILSLPRCHSMRLCQLSYPILYQLLWIDVRNEAARDNVKRDCSMRRANLRWLDSDFQRGACCAIFSSQLEFLTSIPGRLRSGIRPTSTRPESETMLRASSRAMAAPKWRTSGSSSLSSRLPLPFPRHRSLKQRQPFKLRAGFLAVNTMDNGGLQWLSPKTSMAIFIYTAPMNPLSNGHVSIMEGIFVVELQHDEHRRPRLVGQLIPIIESAESTVATVLVTEGSPFLEHGLHLDHFIIPTTTSEDFAMMASELKFAESEPWSAMEAEGLAELWLKCLPFDARHGTCCGLQKQHMIVR